MSKSYLPLMAGAAMVGFFVPCIAIVLFVFFVDGFIPSPALRPFADVSAPAVAVLYGAFTWPSALKELSEAWLERAYREIVKSICLVLFVPLFGAGIWYWFLQGPASYVLHQASSEANAYVVESVAYADRRGVRGCRARAVLVGGRFLWNRQICGLSEAAVISLRAGGEVKLYGSMSKYGFAAGGYEYRAISK